jgi:hypothetical protein
VATPRPIDLAPLSGITRSQIVERAQSWLRPSIAYSQTHFHTNEYGTYRTDCSGYVSMAWALPGKPPNRHGGLDTIGLAAVSFVIEKAELLPGDVLLRTEGTSQTRHVAIFDKWVDESTYWGFEQVGGTGTVYREIGYPYNHIAVGYRAARYIGVID